jgi:WG containing repeat
MMQKSFLMLAVSFVFGTAAQAQTQNWEWTLEPQFYIEPFLDMHIFPQFYDGMMMVQKEEYGQIGFVNQRGELAVLDTFDYTIDQFFFFQANLAIVFQPTTGRCGFIDKTGNWVIPPQFLNAGLFSEGLASAKIDSNYGFIDTSGKWVIEPQFREVGSFDAGVAPVVLNKNWGAIDKTGKWVIPATFPKLSMPKNFSFQPEEFTQALRKIRHSRHYKKDSSAKTERGWQRIHRRAHREYKRDIKGYKIRYENNQYGIKNKAGKWIIQPQFDEIHAYGKGLFGVVQNQKLGFIRLTSAK